eukprot:scaffold978_cov172-Ochromonas_danica.AAC.25
MEEAIGQKLRLSFLVEDYYLMDLFPLILYYVRHTTQTQSIRSTGKQTSTNQSSNDNDDMLLAQGFVIWESSAAAKKLLALGIPAEKVLEENFSLDTIGNAYFLRMIHVENCEFEKLIIITNDWHMSRTRAIFDTVFLLPMRSSSLQVTSHSSLHLTYETVPAGVSDQSILAARIAREQQSLITFNEKTRTLWKSMQDLHHWLFVEHNAYASKRLLPKKEDQQKDVNTLALSTY